MKSGNHIVFLTPGFAAGTEDTTCIPPLYLLLDEFSALYPEIKISVIAFQYPFEEKIYTRSNITIYSMAGKNKGFPYRFYLWWKVYRCFKRLYIESKVSVIHAVWLTECTFIGGILSRRFSCKLFATIMGQDAQKINRYLPFIKKYSPEVIACSSYAALIARDSGVEVKNLIPFGIDKDAKNWQRKNETPMFDVIGVGNFGPIKNYLLFTEILLKVRKEFPELKAILIGKGQQLDAIKRLLNSTQADDMIFFPGHIPRDKAIAYMLNSRIFLHTSSYEGQGYVYMEALGCGLEVVSFPVGYLPESDKTHACISSDEMVEVIISLLKKSFDPKPVITTTIRNTAEEYYKLYQPYLPSST